MIGQKQSQLMAQKMIMSQNMINAVNLLNLSSEELQEEIVKEVKRNPALIFKNSSFVTQAAYEESSKHQDFLESLKDDSYKTLQTNLLEQARETIQDEYILDAAVHIIQNLDINGFNWVPIDELFSAFETDKKITKAEINKALKIVRRLEPIGCACDGFKHSLAVQAKIYCESPKTGKIIDVYEKIYALTVDIIKNHYELLASVSDIGVFLQKLKSKKIIIDRETAEEVISLVKSLNPYPGRIYSEKQTENNFIIPVAEIIRDSSEFKIIINDEEIPALEISSVYASKKNNSDKKKSKEISELLKRAEMFMEVLAYRNRTILKILTVIVNIQKNFFGGRYSKAENKILPGYLRPLKQIDVAQAVNLHPSTVSRVCNEKYIRCEWGLFEIKDFFTPEVSGGLSKDYVLNMIKNIIENDKNKLTDLKISERLKEQGIDIASRTVNKYRKELGLPSSYAR